ncbi:hypothetical protein POM88_026038 [Heracleum sosnowskyi]|uniref:Retrotransposon Copia-like N-terminal domain-containing protein n=1 Tax=Heracleum sosnowskyi TaxID=360622 RepID=A0AAD8MNQ0_9APIA|nr:hypothetical protein POM88_026038 [Heracleum sosnowskyi]
MANSSSITEPLLTIQNFHQCSNLVTLNLSQTNFLSWKSQVIPLIRSLGFQSHIEEGIEPPENIISEGKDSKKEINPAYNTWLNNYGLLTTWLLGTIAEDVLFDLDDTTTAFCVWKYVEDRLLPSSKEKEILLTDTLMLISGFHIH